MPELARRRAVAVTSAETPGLGAPAPTPAKISRPAGRTLPLVFLALGAFMLAGLSFGAVDALTDEGGASGTDVIRLAVMALVALAFVSQLLAVLRWTAAGRRLLLSIPWFRPARRGRSGVPPLLDRVSVARLRELAPAGLGVAGRGAAITATGRRAAGAGVWFAMLFAAVAFTAAGVSALAVSVGISLTDGGGIGVAEAVQIALLPIATLALFSLVRIAVRSIADPRQRRPGRLLRRLFRYVMRSFDRAMAALSNASGAASSAGQVGLRVAAASLATATVIGLGVAAPLIENDDSGPATVVVAASPTPEPTAAATATPEPTDRGIDTPAATTPTPTTPAVTPPPTTPLPLPPTPTLSTATPLPTTPAPPLPTAPPPTAPPPTAPPPTAPPPTPTPGPISGTITVDPPTCCPLGSAAEVCWTISALVPTRIQDAAPSAPPVIRHAHDPASPDLGHCDTIVVEAPLGPHSYCLQYKNAASNWITLACVEVTVLVTSAAS